MFAVSAKMQKLQEQLMQILLRNKNNHLFSQIQERDWNPATKFNGKF